MDKKEIKAQAESYCDNPKSWRKSPEGQKALAELDPTVRAKVAEVLQARRGFRKVNGVLEFDKKTLKSEIERLEQKIVDTKAKLPLLKEKLDAYKDEYAERFEDNQTN